MCFFWKCYKVAESAFLTKMIWHFAVGEADNCQRVWNGVTMAADKTGIPHSASGHHDDSSRCSTLRWWRLRDDGCWCFSCFSEWRDKPKPVDAGDRVTDTILHCSLSSFLAPLSPRPSLRAPLPPCSKISPETNADQYLFPWIPGSCCKDCCKAFSLTPLCLETMVPRPTPPSSSLPLHTTRLSRVSWQMLSEACTYTQNTLCLHLLGLLKFTVV